MVVDAEDPDSIPFLAAFSADGVYQQADPDGINGLGAWESTGPTPAALTFVQQFSDEEGNLVGRTTIRATIELASDGQSLTAQFTIKFDEEGMSSGEYGPGAVTGTRIVVEPMGTPAGPFEDLEGTEPASGDTPIVTETTEAATTTTS